MYFKEDTKESSDDYMKTYNVMRLGDIAFEGTYPNTLRTIK